MEMLADANGLSDGAAGVSISEDDEVPPPLPQKHQQGDYANISIGLGVDGSPQVSIMPDSQVVHREKVCLSSEKFLAINIVSRLRTSCSCVYFVSRIKI